MIIRQDIKLVWIIIWMVYLLFIYYCAVRDGKLTMIYQVKYHLIMSQSAHRLSRYIALHYDIGWDFAQNRQNSAALCHGMF